MTQLKVFLCHSSKDKPAVRELYKKLHVVGWLDPWLDEEKLLPGHDWHVEIEKAVEVTHVVIVLLSNQSVSQEGYVQRELKLALDIADEKPEGTIFILPLRLDDCPVPRRLKGWHYVDYFPADRKDWALEKMFASLKARADSLGISTEKLTPEISTPTPKPMSLPKQAPVSNHAVFAGMEFMRVPAGTFIMGSNDYDNEKPQHTVDIPYDYWIGRYPVTNEQYALFVQATGESHPVSAWENKRNHPVTEVSWYDAQAYIQWLNETQPLTDGLVFRLPTEAEWEKAARGTDGRKYPWGNQFDASKCNSSPNLLTDISKLFGNTTTPVGKYSPQGDSPYGCADMAGNVWDWVSSLHKSYPYNAKDGRENLTTSGSRALRGCSWINVDLSVRSAVRGWFAPLNTVNDVGFRCARSLP